MKTLLYLGSIALIFGITSCSTCYECSQEINVNGQAVQSEPRDVCSADGSEIDELEAEGYTCNVAS